MPSDRRGNRVVPALIALLLIVVAVDAGRRAVSRRAGPAPVTGPVGGLVGEPATTPASADTARTRSLGASAPDESARRRALRERIARDAAGTYLPETIAQSDSMLRRWPDQRLARPVRVAVVRGGASGFREDYVANLAWAVGRWNAALLPVHLEIAADTAGADVVVRWQGQLDSNRTGRADITWDNYGRIGRVAIALATHTPGGRPLDGREMVALALHELGHALGLGHSPERDDVLYPMTRASELTERDRKTARLLYALPPGSLRDR